MRCDDPRRFSGPLQRWLARRRMVQAVNVRYAKESCTVQVTGWGRLLHRETPKT